ncbi:hypothetical protein NQZ68_018351 [Dissostichus eleginoides]|nr:hypothetical protein NQZ68_018351 [Dissostichus eleginoides]
MTQTLTLVPPTRTATTAGGGFPTQSQRRWWQLQEWRYYVHPDKKEKLPRNSRSGSVFYLAPNSAESYIRGKGRQPAADGRGRTAARTHSVVFVIQT